MGSTGSIGTSTLDVVRRNRDRFEIFALVAGRNACLLAQQIREFHPKIAVVASSSDLQNLIKELEPLLPKADWPELGFGPDWRVASAIAAEVDFVLSAIVGVEGLEATYEAVRVKKRIGLANKETLVAAGSLVMEAARQSGAEIIPVDSEHNGAHQCLRAGRRDEVTRLILTASGGPFRTKPASEFEAITPEQALNHPTWKMGSRITIDSATLMNKGFEVIEACWLFDFSPTEVDVVVHPQSKVHAMVEYNDGSVIAQVSATDMRMPIQYALTYPERADAPVPRLDWSEASKWEFYPPDYAKFPLLGMAYEAHRVGGSAGCTLNAADEIAVDAFLNGQVSFTGIAEVIRETLDRIPSRTIQSIGELLELDKEARQVARACVGQRVTAQASSL
ncbi:MAG TPA: 1-deoxy-D-xylulose-5-phosphate reductoisomerase [Chthoniobacterales bacterium]|nr:1-deoxy-D-xylulose-5-phosphate reductoisomerase [Chthoniobacterales bacterium]